MNAGKLGALSAVTASLCCLGPTVLAAMGLGWRLYLMHLWPALNQFAYNVSCPR